MIHFAQEAIPYQICLAVLMVIMFQKSQNTGSEPLKTFRVQHCSHAQTPLCVSARELLHQAQLE